MLQLGGNEVWKVKVGEEGGARPGLTSPRDASERLHPEPSGQATDGQGGPRRVKGRPFSNKANLSKPLTEGKEPAGLDREEKRTSSGRCHPCRSWLGNFFLKPLIMGGTTTVCSCRSWREEAVGRISSPVLAAMAALMPAVQHVLPPPPSRPSEASAVLSQQPTLSTPRAGHSPGEKRALSWEAEALGPSPIFALNQQPGPGQISTLSGLLFLCPNHETTHLLSLRVCREE